MPTRIKWWIKFFTSTTSYAVVQLGWYSPDNTGVPLSCYVRSTMGVLGMAPIRVFGNHKLGHVFIDTNTNFVFCANFWFGNHRHASQR
jgi:hypothetical protein